jgi:selenocysteine-specific elongation factor
VSEPNTETPLRVVATAGHVDHGKSSLILLLTGIEPDRLEEEQRRGLTIDLGYAWCTLPSGREIGFVDVPGHERFVRTMLAGVGPVRLVLFVVAADEGWKPQSEEHLAIVDVLGVDGAVVALTKSDLVSVDRLEAAEVEIRERLRGTALEGSPIVGCSTRSGAGMGELVAALDAMVAAAPLADEDERARLYVDRVFTIAGAGTVVTGTLVGGRLVVGDEVEAAPSGLRARIRGLQTHKRQIELARPVSRVAVNLAGVDRTRLERGDVLVRPDEWLPTSVIESRIRPVRGLAHPVTGRGAFTFHAGTAERGAAVRLYGATALGAEGGLARIRLSAPLVLDVGDRFVLRESGRRETVAGGVVLDLSPPRRPGAGAGERLERRERASREELPAVLLAERGAIRTEELRLLTGAKWILTWTGGPSALGDWYVAERVRESVRRAVLDDLSAFHRANPLAEGVPAASARSVAVHALRSAGAAADSELADAILDELVREGEIVRSGATLRLAGHEDADVGGEVARVAEAVASAEPTPPSIAELRAGGFDREAIEAAVRSGTLVRIAPDLVVTAGFVARAVEAVREAGSAGITVSAVRQRLGTSRKFAVPLMEHLDRAGLTRRSGDLRFARGS